MEFKIDKFCYKFLQKTDFEKHFPPFHSFSTKSVPDLRGFQIVRIFLSPKIRAIRGLPVLSLKYYV